MKPNILILLFIVLLNYNTLSQPGRNKIFVKQQHRMPDSKAKIHANSNSVFGTWNRHPKYNNKTQPKEEIKKTQIEEDDKMQRNKDNSKK